MAETIASKIIEQRTISIEKGKEKYNAYFMKVRFFKRFREDVNNILRLEGCEDVIVEA